jgi:hypothetical protein
MENLTNRVSLSVGSRWVVALALVGSVACGPMEDAPASVDSPSTREQDLEGENGLAVNGLSYNGLAVNGLAVNGLAVNGLSYNGLASENFAAWFTQSAAQNAMLMKYVVQCALPAGESRSYQDSSTGTSYTWEGSLGLAQGWAHGQAITEAEQQLVSACLAAHLNKFGMHVPLSVLGLTAEQEPIPYSTEEIQTFSRREACFFGNLFTQEGVFAGVDRDYLNEGESSPRACGLTTSQDVLSSQCSPVVHVQNCETFCTLDPSGLFYTECRYMGRTYLPLTTRIRPQEIYTCGDGVCQFTESCGTGNSANSCASDCGSCE